MTLEEAFAYWSSVAPRRESTRRRYFDSVSRLARAGLRLIDDVTRESVIAVQREMLTRMKPISVRTEIAALRAILSQLEDHGRFPTGRLAEIRKVAIKPPKSGERARRVLHLDRPMFESLVASAERVAPRIELPIRVATLAGPRVGELARMRAEDVDGRIFWIENLPEYGEAGSCKTSSRPVQICEELHGLLRDRLPRSGWIFPSGGLGGRRPVTPFISRWTLEDGIKLARRAAGLPNWVTFTVLRHTRASWWLQAGRNGEKGVSIYKVADWLGHTVETCEKHYGSLVDGYDPECERMPAA